MGPPAAPTSAIFAALAGRWALHRTLRSARPTLPSGVFMGTAIFTPRPPTTAGLEKGDAVPAGEYTYEEDGAFAMDAGPTMHARRAYVYRLEASRGGGSGSISAWFVKPDVGAGMHAEVDYLFHRLEFVEAQESATGDATVYVAKGHHLCVKDTYDCKYQIHVRGQGGSSSLERFSVEYMVAGPEKDYILSAEYTKTEEQQDG